MYLPPPEYGYLLGLIDDTGIYEHARFGVPRREHGYTLDDASRALITLSSGPDDEPVVRAETVLLAFILDAMTPDGRFRNRLSFSRRWDDDASNDDTQGRGIWALCVAATKAHRRNLRDAAASALTDIPTLQSTHVRPLAYAALGAHALWISNPEHPDAVRFALPAATRLSASSRPWPEERLAYANASVPAAMLAAGDVCDDQGLVEKGLQALEWLSDVDTQDAHFSFTPVGGWAPGEPRPGFDQQPIEASAMSDACERAWILTGDPMWRENVFRCGQWLLGSNDIQAQLYSPETGATFDGLTDDGSNSNSGAESTIAGLDVLQACHRVGAGASTEKASGAGARTRS